LRGEVGSLRIAAMAAIGDTGRFTFEIEGLSEPTWVARFEGEEAISQLFHFQVLLTSKDPNIAFADVIGKPALLTLDTSESEPRHVHGIVSRFVLGDEGKKFTAYHATLVPSVWRLLHRHDSRIFQEMTVPEIIEKVLKGAGYGGGDYSLFMEGSHPVREYCVQYRESDWAFLCRLMEEEGIFYFFQHAADKDVLRMGDGPSAHAPIVAPDTIAFKSSLGSMAHGESVSRFTYSEEVRTGKVTLSDFNFKKPSLSLRGSQQAALDDDLEIYDYPGEYEVPADGTTLTKIRLEEQQSIRKVGEGDSGCMRFTPGYLFTLSDHSRDACNRKYLLVRVRHSGAQPQMGEAAAASGPSYSQTFQVIPDDVPFRPARRTPRPTIKGVQTAIVVGPSGEEIHTDEHARVKVQFHWDRLGKNDDKSSCWIRVSQLWAGPGWGAMYIPRIGHEVIVDFIEGDPDRPIIVGRVYHGANVPPYPLPAEKTKSTIKSESSPGGGGSNEFRFEDKAGSEEIYLHGQKDWNIKIENDKNQLVGHDETLEVGNDRTKEVKHDQSETIGNDKTTDVGRHHNETIGANESLSVGGNRSVSVGKNHTESVAANQTITVGANLEQSVEKSMSLSVGGSKNESVSGESSETVSKSKSSVVEESYTLTISKDMTVTVTKDSKEEVQENKTVVVGKKLSIQCGDATITVEKNGNITAQGKNITLKGDGPIKIEGKKLDVKSEGAVNLEASGKVVIKGSNVGVN
jgi:type VI secretion system secreted protein VgrG